MKMIQYILCGLMAMAVSNRSDSQSFIRINQSGYHPDEDKIAIVISKKSMKGDFQVLGMDSRESLLEKPLIPIERPGWGTYSWFYRLDFSSL